jgi:hypothetical protein
MQSIEREDDDRYRSAYVIFWTRPDDRAVPPYQEAFWP